MKNPAELTPHEKLYWLLAWQGFPPVYNDHKLIYFYPWHQVDVAGFSSTEKKILFMRACIFELKCYNYNKK